jgi:hypothetical protein
MSQAGDDALLTITSTSAGAASLWPIGHAAFMSWPMSATAMPGGNGFMLGAAYFFGVIGCAVLVGALIMSLLRRLASLKHSE